MSGGGTQKSLRKALGALKDTTTVSLAKVNSDYKVGLIMSDYLLMPKDSTTLFLCFHPFGWFSIFQDLDIAIVKATNHVERPAKERHIRGGCSLPLCCSSQR